MDHPERSRRRSGFTLVELMIVVAIIAIIASLALPSMVNARANSHEAAAISALRSLSTAQAQLQSQNAIDTDGNGAGEFGSLGELTGVAPLRISVGGAPNAGAVGVDELTPTALPPSFGRIDATGVVMRQGYAFRVFLPNSDTPPVGIAEEDGGGFQNGPFPDSHHGSNHWCAYAWPYDSGRTGRRAFFINETGEVLATANRGANGAPVYSGLDPAGEPGFSAAYLTADMTAGTAVSTIGVDGNLWVHVQ